MIYPGDFKNVKISFKELFCALSDALDYVENSLFGTTKNHAKRVAYIAAVMGKKAGLGDSELSDITACALLHDNALTEYIHTEQQAGINVLLSKEITHIDSHCISGEKNISVLPFYPRVKNVILYHHERADGYGPFHKKTADTLLAARLIHLADLIDLRFASEQYTATREAAMKQFAVDHTDTLFDSETVGLFISCLEDGLVQETEQQDCTVLLKNAFPEKFCDYGKDEIISVGAMFAKIIDYKSNFTSRHSLGIATKALRMAQFYGWDDETQGAYYLAGALHDIGKLAVTTDILEKPDALTAQEYKQIQFHAYATNEILSGIAGFEDIREWAAYHHEKLDGSGYPFGKTAAQLPHKSRLMACLDTYQALREVRPYKQGMTHDAAVAFLRDQAARGKLDAECVHDIDVCFRSDPA
jgi:HD-GYP domain-containing protein (c-di-GMP phosphodiesterase class II)